MYVYKDLFHKEYLIKRTHLHYKLQDLKQFYYNFVYFYATFYTNIDVHPLRMIHEGTKNVGVLVL
jgi:hypothetical protein